MPRPAPPDKGLRQSGICTARYKVCIHIDTGKDEVTIEPHEVETQYKPGSLDIYLEQQGSIRMWTTEGQCDIYA